MNDLAFWFNIVEAGLWFVLGVAMLVSSSRATNRRRLLAVAGFALIAFGFSDLVETQTGAWWRPWWLLAWKTACMLVLALFVLDWLRGARAQRTKG